MTATAPAPPRLTDDQLAELLGVMSESDSVELKLTVPERDQRSAVAALGLDPLEAQLRQVVFFDTPDLALDRHGVVVRARRVQGKGDDSVVKLRPVVPSDMSRKLRKSEAFRVEVDALPGGFVCSGTFKQALRRPAVRDVLGGTLPIHKLFSKEQREFFRAHAPADLELDELSVLGPILILKLRFEPKELGRRLVAEVWVYPDGSRVLELSTRCSVTEAFQAATELRVFLTGRGIDAGGKQQTKTRKALAYFASLAGDHPG